MDCQKCGKQIPSNASFCEYCGHPVSQLEPPAQPEAPIQQEPVVPAEKPENVLTGIVGALIGAAIGGGSILLLSQLGFVASLSGLILAVCTLKGYELLGGRLSTKGIIIGIVLMLIMPYLADRLDWAIVLTEAFSEDGVTLGQAFAAIPVLLSEGFIETSTYVTNLLMIYGFTALGAFGTLRNLFKKKS